MGLFEPHGPRPIDLTDQAVHTCADRLADAVRQWSILPSTGRADRMLAALHDYDAAKARNQLVEETGRPAGW